MTKMGKDEQQELARKLQDMAREQRRMRVDNIHRCQVLLQDRDLHLNEIKRLDYVTSKSDAARLIDLKKGLARVEHELATLRQSLPSGEITSENN